MDYSNVAFLLMALGLALLVAEVFIPSGGMILVLAIICLGGSIWCAWTVWWDTNRIGWWIYLASLFFLIPSSVGAALFALPRTSFGRRILLDAPTLDEVTPYARETAHLQSMLGRSGKTLSLLNPGGLVLVDGQRLHAESEGMVLDSGTEIEVVGVRGNRLLVRELKDKGSDHSRQQADEFMADADMVEPDAPLDFDVPQS